ncbi:MAG TPA: Crp/Fnr family transcriptional regulator [Micropepsaceae bacterium]|jgi:CRP-like cAMP-binding protein|nr:Crp/Fnr family transcriptional regulator [Micropepsaceae bacterium]
MVTRAEFQGENQLLTSLLASDYSLLRPHLKEVRLEQGSVLQDHGERIQYVYFPVSGMISLLSVMRDGKGVETVVVGREGALGAHCAFGIWHAYSRAVVQISGRAVRIAGAQFQKAVRESERMGDLFLRYRELRLAQTQQAAACNALHGAESRLSRWLLQTSDVIGADMVPLTQEFLSQMLGVRRTTVTAIARTLQETGMIHYTRGRIEISDREKLEKSACECYEVLRRQPAQILFRPKR